MDIGYYQMGFGDVEQIGERKKRTQSLKYSVWLPGKKEGAALDGAPGQQSDAPRNTPPIIKVSQLVEGIKDDYPGGLPEVTGQEINKLCPMCDDVLLILNSHLCGGSSPCSFLIE